MMLTHVNHPPSEIALTCNPLLPNRRYCIPVFLGSAHAILPVVSTFSEARWVMVFSDLDFPLVGWLSDRSRLYFLDSSFLCPCCFQAMQRMALTSVKSARLNQRLTSEKWPEMKTRRIEMKDGDNQEGKVDKSVRGKN